MMVLVGKDGTVLGEVKPFVVETTDIYRMAQEVVGNSHFTSIEFICSDGSKLVVS